MYDDSDDRRALKQWAQHKNEKIQGMKNGTWSVWDDIGDLPADARYAVPAYMAGQSLSTQGTGGSNPYDDGANAYDKAKEYAQHVGEARQQAVVPPLSNQDANAKSAWNYFMTFGKKP